ncbi:MAG TPA: hypothetical protein VFF50_07905, partial [Candidatus Deferrimicrobiaceae bacterium]|nr:hypothetical protein [Candidatus Deferrimicrobiaceae bacterium]
PRTPIHPIGVYFSPQTRNFYADDFLRSYRGILLLLMQSHREFQIVTPRTLHEFHGEALVLPGVRILNSDEQAWLKQYAGEGKKLIITGNNPVESGNQPSIATFPDCPGKGYIASLEAGFDQASPKMQQAFLDSLPPSADIEISASPEVATSIASVNGETHVFLANFAGLVGGKNPVQTPQSVTIVVPDGRSRTAYFLPFLGDTQKLEGTSKQGKVTFTLPPISKGAVFWLQAD